MKHLLGTLCVQYDILQVFLTKAPAMIISRPAPFSISEEVAIMVSLYTGTSVHYWQQSHQQTADKTFILI
jgi:hypothetical protein